MGEKNGGRANLIKQRRYDLVPGYTKGVQKKICTPYVHPGVQACTHFHLTPSMYSIFHKIPNASATIFIFKKYFGILCLILKHELCKVIHSTHYVKLWKLKKNN